MSESNHGLPETGPISIPVVLPPYWQQSLASAPPAQTSGTHMAGLIPDDVEEPTFVLRGNKLKCPVCGDTSSTRRKYIDHYRRRHGSNTG